MTTSPRRRLRPGRGLLLLLPTLRRVDGLVRRQRRRGGLPPMAYRPAWPSPDGAVAYQPAPPTLDARTNGFAVAALVLGIVWMFWIGSVLSVIFGHIALHQIHESSGWQRGRGLAIAGLLLGYLALALLGISIVAAIVAG